MKHRLKKLQKWMKKYIHKVAFFVNIAALITTLVALLSLSNFAPDAISIGILLVLTIVFAVFIIKNYSTKWEKSFKYITFLIVNVLWLALTSWFVFIVYQANSTLSNLSNVGCVENCASVAEIDKPITIYISGEDAYGETDDNSRSDVNQLVIMNPEKQSILIVNTPRDYYVKLHSYGPLPDKLTHAGNFGVEESMNTLEDLYDIDISRYIKVNFSSLTYLVDILGGITVYSDYEFTDAKKNHYVKGPNELDSYEALWFSRERYAFSDGDNQRGKNQQKVLEAIFAKLKSTDLLKNYQQILNALSTNLKTNIAGSDLQKIVQSIIKKQYTFENINATGTGAHLPTYSYPNQKLYVMKPNMASVEKVKAKISEYLNN